MANNLADTIQHFIGGDDLEVRRTITNVPAGQTLVMAWLTVKALITDADPGLLQKTITVTDTPGVGQIVSDGSVDQTGEVRFDLTGANTLLVVPDPTTTQFLFDIQVQTSGGKFYTPVKGKIWAEPQVTVTTS